MVTISNIPTFGDDTGIKNEILQTPWLAPNITFREVGQFPLTEFSPRFAHLIQSRPIPGSPDYPPNTENILDK
jgi:hypothetical protein